MTHRGQLDSGESCIALQSELTRSLISAAFSRRLQYANFVLQKYVANEATDERVDESKNLGGGGGGGGGGRLAYARD